MDAKWSSYIHTCITESANGIPSEYLVMKKTSNEREK